MYDRRPRRMVISTIRAGENASSEVSRCAVEMGSPASRAISVSECSLPSVKVSRIEVILLVTDRPDSAEFPATRYLRVIVAAAKFAVVSSNRCRAPGMVPGQAGWGPSALWCPGSHPPSRPYR